MSSQEIYKRPSTLQNAALFDSDENLWNNCQVVVLKYNFRQGIGQWNDTLNRIRFGDITEDDIQLLESRRMKNFPNKNFERATHLYSGNREVREHNEKVLNSLHTLHIMQKAELDCPRGFKPWVDEKKGTVCKSNFMDTLVLKIGIRVMVVANIDIPDGLVNGSLGKVIDFVFHPYKAGEPKRVKAVLVQLDSETMGQNTRNKYLDLSPKVRALVDSKLEHRILFISSIALFQ